MLVIGRIDRLLLSKRVRLDELRVPINIGVFTNLIVCRWRDVDRLHALRIPGNVEQDEWNSRIEK